MTSGAGPVVGTVAFFAVIAGLIALFAGGWLAGLLVFIALCVALVGMALLVDDSPPLGWSLLVGGLGLLVFATWLSGMDGRWWWIAPWLILGAFTFSAGATAREHSSSRGDTLMTIGVLEVVFSIVGPLLVYGGLAGARENGWSAPGVDLSLSPLTDFASTVLTSPWGYVGLLVAFLVGVTWRGLWAGVAAVLLVPLTVLVAGWIDADAADTMSTWLASGPIDQSAQILRGSLSNWDTAGWGVLIVGAVMTLVTAAALRRTVRANSLLALGVERQRRGAEEDPQAFVTRHVDAWLQMCSALVFLGTFFTVPIVMWLALRRVADGEALPFPAIHMSDLAIPQFRPVWELSYFLVALALAILALVIGRLYGRYNAAVKMPIVGNPVWQAVTPFVAALLVPGGVMLLGVASTASLIVVLPVAALGLRKELNGLRMFLPSPDRDRPIEASRPGPAAGPDTAPDMPPALAGMGNLLWLAGATAGSGSSDAGAASDDAADQAPTTDDDRPDVTLPQDDGPTGPDEPPVADQEAMEPVLQPRSRTETTLLADSGRGLVAALIGRDAGRIVVVCLREDGAITRWWEHERAGDSVVPVARPLGLAAATAGRVYLVDGEGRIVELEIGEGRHEIVHSCAPGEIACFAGHPHGNHVAFALAGDARVKLFTATTENVRDLATEVPVPTALCFSDSGRHLAIGDDDGGVRRFDVVRKTGEPLGDAGVGACVELLAPAPKTGWAAAFAGGHVAVWDGAGAAVGQAEAGGDVTALAVDPARGLVAAGRSDGSLRVWSADLDTVVCEDDRHDGAVRTLCFIGDSLASAGADGKVLMAVV